MKGLETKLWHKLCTENTRGQKPPKTPKPQSCGLLHLSEGDYLSTNLFKIFQSRLTQGKREMLILSCVFGDPGPGACSSKERKTTESCKPGSWDTAGMSLKQLLCSQKHYKELGSRTCSPQTQGRIDCWAGTGDHSAETLCVGGRLLTSFFLSLFPGHLSFPLFRSLICLLFLVTFVAAVQTFPGNSLL